MIEKKIYEVIKTVISQDDPFHQQYYLDLDEAVEDFNLKEYESEERLINKDHEANLYELKVVFEEEEDTDFEDYEIDDYYDYEVVDNIMMYQKQYNINDNANQLLEDFEESFKEKYGSKSIKYHTITVEDEETLDEYYIGVRIADHSPNMKNNDRFGFDNIANISVTITDQDPTEKKFPIQSFHSLRFTTSNTLKEIEKTVFSKIQEIISSIENEKI